MSAVQIFGSPLPAARRVTPGRIELAMRVVDDVIKADRALHGMGDVINSFLTRWLEGFSFHGWSDDAVRAVVRAVIENAPTEDCNAFLTAIERQALPIAAELRTIQAIAAEERLIRRAAKAFARELDASLVDLKTSDVAGDVVELRGPAASPESHGIVACYRVGARGRVARMSDVEMQRRWRETEKEMRASDEEGATRRAEVAA